MASVELKNISKIYESNNYLAVDDISLDIDHKEFIVLVGPSGCGKSTVLRMIAGLEEITSGQLYIGDELVNNVSPKDREIAMVFQTYALYPHMTVFENMEFPLKMRGINKDQRQERVLKVAEILELSDYLKSEPRALSGGQRQRVALGRAMVRKPKVFLLDEPLSNLDAKLRVKMRSEIVNLHRKLETTFIYVTHDQTEAMTMGDKIAVLNDGVLEQFDTPKNLYNEPKNKFVAEFIGSPQMNIFHAKLEKEDARVFALVNDKRIYLSEKRSKELEDFKENIYLGIRSEDLHFSEKDQGENIFKVLVNNVEQVGSDTYAYFHIDGHKDEFVARFNPPRDIELDSEIYIEFDKEKLFVFDYETEESLFI